jgi:hypothetical protein
MSAKEKKMTKQIILIRLFTAPSTPIKARQKNGTLLGSWGKARCNVGLQLWKSGSLVSERSSILNLLLSLTANLSFVIQRPIEATVSARFARLQHAYSN